MTPRGRRPTGSPDAREAILAAASRAFARDGYRTSLRGIARDAGVDPALVHHYFPQRAELFAKAVVEPLAGDRADLMGRVAAVGELSPEQLGEGIVRMVVSLWDDVEPERFAAVIHTLFESDDAVASFRDFLTTGVVGPIMERYSPDRPQLRTQLVATQMLGLGIARWVAYLDRIEALDAEEVVGLMGPTIQRYAVGELPETADGI